MLLKPSEQTVDRTGFFHRTLYTAILPQLLLDNLASFCGVVTFSFFTIRGCDPLSTGIINNQNQVSLFLLIMIVLIIK